jgi:hypothetical protein
MTNDQIQQAAIAAISAMDDKAKAEFIKMFEANSSMAGTVANAYAIEGTRRQITLATMALENSRIMDGLVNLVADEIFA